MCAQLETDRQRFHIRLSCRTMSGRKSHDRVACRVSDLPCPRCTRILSKPVHQLGTKGPSNQEGKQKNGIKG